jgi:hypothetical protein
MLASEHDANAAASVAAFGPHVNRKFGKFRELYAYFLARSRHLCLGIYGRNAREPEPGTPARYCLTKNSYINTLAKA